MKKKRNKSSTSKDDGKILDGRQIGRYVDGNPLKQKDNYTGGEEDKDDSKGERSNRCTGFIQGEESRKALREEKRINGLG